MNKPNSELIITTKDVCEILGISKMYVSILVKNKKLVPLKKLNKEYIWWKPDIDLYNTAKKRKKEKTV